MARQLTLEEVDRIRSARALGLSLVDRILDGALRRASDDARRAAEKALSTKPVFRDGRAGSRLSKAICRALKSHYAQVAVKPSARIAMPGGGIGFHFDHTSVSGRSMALQKGMRRSGVNTWGKQGFARDIHWTSRASAHQIYIERPSARDELEAADLARLQRYIEDVGKVSLNGGGETETDFSFGNIGRTLEERAKFWELACRGAERENGIIQHRFVMQLPKEATARERKAIMEAYIAPFRAAGMRYWIALHAPTNDNDPRNFHAHMVMYHRPAQKVWLADAGANMGFCLRAPRTDQMPALEGCLSASPEGAELDARQVRFDAA
eukprot:gene27089-34990_t